MSRYYKRILFIRPGVIGSTFAGRLAMEGHPVTILARGNRLGDLNRHGFLLEGPRDKAPRRTNVRVIDCLEIY